MPKKVAVVLVKSLVVATFIARCLAATGDSRVRVSIVHQLAFQPHDRIPVTVRLYDPLTDLTYHQSTDPQLIEALGVLWNSVYQNGKCGTVNSDLGGQNFTRVCDPEDFIPKFEALELRKILNQIPQVTGCQCDSLQLCNQYNSGFQLMVAIVPTIMKPIRAHQLPKGNTKLPSPIKTLIPQQQQPQQQPVVVDKLSFTVRPTDMVIPRIASGQQVDMVNPDADIYELVAHYLRALWATGSCDEDMVICFFPKEKKLSMSIGSRLLQKMTAECLESSFVETARQLALLSTQDQNLAFAFDDVNQGNAHQRGPSVKRQQIEHIRMTALFKHFLENIDKLILSRSDTPCSSSSVKSWSNYEILGFAILSGIGLALAVAILLKICGLVSNYIDLLIDDTPSDAVKHDDEEKPAATTSAPAKPVDVPTITTTAPTDSNNSNNWECYENSNNNETQSQSSQPINQHFHSRTLSRTDSVCETIQMPGMNTTVTVSPESVVIERLSEEYDEEDDDIMPLESIAMMTYSAKPTIV